MKTILNANLPQNRVTHVALSCEAYDLVGYLDTLGINTVQIKTSNKILPCLASHTDLHILPLGAAEVWISRDQRASKPILEQLGFNVHVLEEDLSINYPNDVMLNAAIVGNNVFLNKKSICKDINFTDKNIINVKQGYTKCSICIINSNAIITDDKGIHSAATTNQMDSLLIEKGDIVLRGLNYGFIGGCCGLLDKSTLLFNGNLKTHRNYDRIIGFLKNYKVDAMSFGRYPLTDIGGIVPLLEK